MRFRLAELDRQYHRRMAVTFPSASLVVLLALALVPAESILDTRSRLVGQRGPLRILPEIDIMTEESDPRRFTAAPVSAPPADFVVIELDYPEDPAAPPRPEPTPTPREKEEDSVPEFSDFDDLQDALRTTAHPVLAQAEYELIYMERPIYPREAILRGIEGDVEILMLVGTNGRVARVHVVNSGRVPLLEQAASEAVHKSLFRVHRVNGKPTPFWIRVPFQFRLVG